MLFDVLDKPCVWLARILYKFGRPVKVSRSAHSFLWICMGLSTIAGSENAVAATGKPAGEHPAPVFTLGQQEGNLGKARCSFLPTIGCVVKKKFFDRTAQGTSGLQPKSVYKDSSSVNNCHFLWISQLTDEKSVVYTRYKPVICRCMFLVANLDKIRGRGKSRVFAQTVLVDIKNLIHTWPSGASFTIW